MDSWDAHGLRSDRLSSTTTATITTTTLGASPTDQEFEHLELDKRFRLFASSICYVCASTCAAGDSSVYQRTYVLGMMSSLSAHRTLICKSRREGFKDTYVDDLIAPVIKGGTKDYKVLMDRFHDLSIAFLELGIGYIYHIEAIVIEEGNGTSICSILVMELYAHQKRVVHAMITGGVAVCLPTESGPYHELQ
ncbi:hypothetical protein Scep_026524 [Stephania cephalantha]|uniref:Uncharacterized protein n=1 Tax=Stephania cephalantha TaxID=152367 RepID=A0AAP0HTE1_9MAGN